MLSKSRFYCHLWRSLAQPLDAPLGIDNRSSWNRSAMHTDRCDIHRSDVVDWAFARAAFAVPNACQSDVVIAFDDAS